MRHLTFIATSALFFALPVWGQVALVGNSSANGAGPTSPAINTTSTNTTLEVACIGAITDLYSGATVTDSCGNTLQFVGVANDPDGVFGGMWAKVSPTQCSSATISVSQASLYYPAISAAFFSGVASGPDQKIAVTGTSNPFYTGSVTPTNNNEVVVSCNSFSGPTTPVSPLTSVTAGTMASPATITLGYVVQTTAATINPEWNNPGAGAGNGSAGATASFFSQESPAPLAITSTGVPEGFLSTAYSATNSLYSNILTATGGAQPYTWSCPSICALPVGLSLSSSGAITGTPTSVGGPTNVVFKVTDAQSTTATVTLPITVSLTQPSLTAPTGCPIAVQYSSYSGCSFTVVSGGAAPLTLSIPAATSTVYPPEGITVNSSTGALGGTFYGGGEYPFAAQLTDAAGYFATASFTFKGNETVLAGSEWPNGSSIWSHRIDLLPADTSPLGTVASVYASAYLRPLTNTGGNLGAIPQIIVPCTQSFVPITTSQYYSTAPIPSYAPVEAGPNNSGDSHVLTIMQGCGSTPAQEFDLWQAHYNGTGWNAGGAGYQWNVTGSPTTNWGITMPMDQGNADNLGGPMAQNIWKVDDMIDAAGGGTESAPVGSIKYPQRMTMNNQLNGFVWPGTTPPGCCGSGTGGYGPDANRMYLQQDPPTALSGGPIWPTGEMLRLQSSFSTPSCASGNPYAAILFTALREYGIIVADNGGTGYLTLSPDERWASIPALASALNCIKTTVQLQNLEGVNVSGLMPTITSWSVTSNILSATTQNPHGLFSGQKIRLAPQNIPTDAWLNTSIANPGTCSSATEANPCTFTITSVPTTTTFTADLTTGSTTHADTSVSTDPVYVVTYATAPGPPPSTAGTYGVKVYGGVIY